MLSDRIQRLLVTLSLAVGAGLFVFLTHIQPSTTQELPFHPVLVESIPLSPHPLPPSLDTWQDSASSGDYFSQVKSTAVGSLVWSQFPVQVYIEPANDNNKDQVQRWVKVVSLAVQEWSAYLPLKVVEQSEAADIAIVQSISPLQVSSTGNLQRVRAAETSYKLYVNNKDASAVLSHRCTIKLNPHQTDLYLQASARHELGHALGIWGHSLVATDVMYFSQVRNPPPISSRDLNTLKRVYEQPTRLGWSLNIHL